MDALLALILLLGMTVVLALPLVTLLSQGIRENVPADEALD